MGICLCAEESGMAENACEKIVEIVGNAPGEDAKTFQLLFFVQSTVRGAPIGFPLAARGNIARESNDAGSTSHVLRPTVDLHRASAPIGGDAIDFQVAQ